MKPRFLQIITAECNCKQFTKIKRNGLFGVDDKALDF